MQPQDPNLTICKVVVGPPAEERPDQEIQQLPNPSDGYCPQDVPSHQPATCSSRQSSIIYSLVGVQKHGGSKLLLPRVTDGTDRKSPQPDTFDSGPDTAPWTLLVDTMRDTNGKLILMEFGTAGEQRRPPLPSCLGMDWTRVSSSDDSGCDDSTENTPTQPYCNNHYRPSGPQGGGDAIASGYRPNCIPANFNQPNCGFEDTRTPYSRTWSGFKQAEDDEEDEALAGEEVCSSSEIPLCHWVVQVQD